MTEARLPACVERESNQMESTRGYKTHTNLKATEKDFNCVKCMVKHTKSELAS